MALKLSLRCIVILFVTAALLLVASAPTVGAEPVASTAFQCNPQPLGEPDPDGGLDDDVKAFGNPVIYGACVFAITVAGNAVVLVIEEANGVCNFATGHNCLKD